MKLATMTSPEFRDWRWRLAVDLRTELEQGYASPRNGEVALVKRLVDAVKRWKTKPFSIGTDRVSVEAAFLHGMKSNVTFTVGSKTWRKELADLLVVTSYVERGAVIEQRVCLVQAKKQHGGDYKIDEGQLALLGGFPSFSGVTGLYSGLNLSLRNQTGILGAYGFLSEPGKLVVVGARVLAATLGAGLTLNASRLGEMVSVVGFRPRDLFAGAGASIQDLLDPNCSDCHHLLFHYRGPHSHVLGPIWAPGTTVQTCLGFEEFVDAWAGMRLGEPLSNSAKITSDQQLSLLLERAACDAPDLSGLAKLVVGAPPGGVASSSMAQAPPPPMNVQPQQPSGGATVPTDPDDGFGVIHLIIEGGATQP